MTKLGASASSRIVLDTSAYSHFRANHAEVVDWIARAEVVYLPVTVLGELEAAFLCGTRTKENQVALRDFLDEPFVAVLPITLDVARVYGDLFATLRRAGTPIPINDVWIAATCIDAGAHLVTFDEDFARIPRLAQTVCSVTSQNRSPSAHDRRSQYD
ncbi:type II toxin-antitoxin system VapC family toxin [Pendulispora albinea]|uniref:Ribonuclease VapC n=1 Tax=Pendulispora albinea TaxID=2741071 RepID=A0ABZ2LWX3_9BACT